MIKFVIIFLVGVLCILFLFCPPMISFSSDNERCDNMLKKLYMQDIIPLDISLEAKYYTRSFIETLKSEKSVA